MALLAYFVKYKTDGGKEVVIKINYEDNGNKDKRLQDGGVTGNNLITTGCKSVIKRKYLKPRYLDVVELGKVYFIDHQTWLNYIDTNKEKIKKVQGETISCTAVNLLY